MRCYSELTPPTAVTHSLSLPFTSADANNLIVAKTSLLQIFTHQIIYESSTPKHGSNHNDSSNAQTGAENNGLEISSLGTGPRPRSVRTTKLVLVAEYTLSGTITSLGRVKTPSSKTGGEGLLVGFKDAKLSLVEWDPSRPGLTTISIHYYEQEELQASPWAPKLSSCVNYLTVDPGSRCAALKFGARNLAILPFKQDDEDVHMQDWDELDGERSAVQAGSKTMNSEGIDTEDTPYGSSFVLRLSSLDPTIIHPVHLSFLYEYREPTFGILSSTIYPAASLLSERKDALSYMVFTLDLNQRASTTILSVSNLPSDLFKVVPLPAPIGGALLVGINELIHIDQAGKANGIAVNEFTKECTSYGLVDQSECRMRLESCQIEILSIETGEMLIILNDGKLAILSFRMDGRSVSGLSVRRVTAELGGQVLSAAATCVSSLGADSIFVGNESSDSVVLGWTQKSAQVSRRKSRIDPILGIEIDEDEDDEEDDDDLYGDAPSVLQVAGAATSSITGDNYVFRIHDSLINIAPITDITFGKPPHSSDEVSGIVSDLELVATVGREKAGSLAVIHRNIQPEIIGRFDFPEARGIWTVSAKKPITKALQGNNNGTTAVGDDHSEYDKLMIVSKAVKDAPEESDVYALTAAGFEALAGTEFEPAAGSTIEVGTLGNGMRVIQVLKSEVRSYDGDLGLAQIIPMYDDDTGAEPKIISASFADPYVLLLRDDSSIFVAQCDADNELEEIEREDDALLSTKWLTGCLYDDTSRIFAPAHVKKDQEQEKKSGENVMMFLLSAGGALHIYALPDLSKAVYIAEGICFVPPVLSADYAARRSATRETLTEIIVADLGDEVAKSPYLILRPSNDDLTIYEPFRITSAKAPNSLSTTLQFLKIHNPHLAKDPEISADETVDNTQDTRDKPMRAVSNLGGYSTVFMPGGSPSFIIKSAKSNPKVLSLQGAGVRGLSSFHTEGCERGFIYADVEGVARVAQLPPNSRFAELGLSLRRVPVGQDVHALSYHAPSECYAVATSIQVPFEIPPAEGATTTKAKDDSSFKATMEQSYLKVLNPSNWTVIDSVQLEPYEAILCVKTLNLVISEVTNERKQLIAVGTAITQGEDKSTKGCIYVYDIINVVPEPDRPETNQKLKLIAREEIAKGAVTSICEVGTQGFMLVAQGQKCMVRGLKEDGTLLPVSFLDMNCYTTSVKELRGTGLCLMADAIKGVWLAGYTEEPYKMMVFGKSVGRMEVVAAELLPDGEFLYMVVADAECNLHILQYDPEHPKSLQGHLLLHRTTFSLGGHLPTTMTLLPSLTPIAPSPDPPSSSSAAQEKDKDKPSALKHAVLLTSQSGALALLTSLTEPQYRRLGALAAHLTNTLHHACGLNPREYRIARDAPESMVGGRAVIDGAVLARWKELGSQRRAEVAGRVGMESAEVRDELGALGELGFL